MNQIATSVEQSKKLLEAGIPAYTASMTHFMNKFANNEYVLANRSARRQKDGEIPAWTLYDLLDYLPLEFMLCSVDGGRCILIIPDDIRATFIGNGNLIDAVIKALIWCKNKGYKFKD